SGAGGFKRRRLPKPRLQGSHGLFRMHRRSASLRLSRRTNRAATSGTQRLAGGGASPRTGELGQMKAMILAAGLGTRLRPLTDTRPKTLVEIGGRTLLEITLARLRSFGVQDVIINVHHFGEMIADYLQANSSFGMHIEVSREDVLLDTGGGLKKTGWFLAPSAEPFFLHT